MSPSEVLVKCLQHAYDGMLSLWLSVRRMRTDTVKLSELSAVGTSTEDTGLSARRDGMSADVPSTRIVSELQLGELKLESEGADARWRERWIQLLPASGINPAAALRVPREREAPAWALMI